jgi:hypothetical protein
VSTIISFVRTLQKIGISFVKVTKGYLTFLRTGVTPPEAYLEMRYLFAVTNGYFNDGVCALLRIRRLTEPVSLQRDSSKIYDDIPPLSDISSFEFDGAVKLRMLADLRESGLSILPKRLSKEGVAKVRSALKTEKGCYRPAEGQELEGPVTINEVPKGSLALYYEPEALLRLPEIAELATDEALRQIAEEYLKAPPILDSVSAWWSFPTGRGASSDAAQLFHYDMDRLKFLKFFVYLTAVDESSGPHCYVKKSHKRLPKLLRPDGRKTNDLVLAHYPPAHIARITGEAGTSFFADTRGLHKGEAPHLKARLLLQLQWSVSLFGQDYPKVPRGSVAEQYLRAANLRPETYGRILF